MSELRILFASYHSYLDPSSGSTISLRDLFQLLVERDWECQVLCGPQLDYEEPRTIAQTLDAMAVPYDTRAGGAHGLDFILYNTIVNRIPVALYETPFEPPARNLSERQGRVHLALFEKVLDQFRPDVLLTYGGQWMAQACMAMARRRGVAVVFWLRNTAYHDRAFFDHVHGVLVPSHYSAEHYRRHLGLECTAIPSPVDWSRVACTDIDRRYLTFVNPTPVKGVYVFARIAQELAKRRPDIPMLVVEGRGNVDWLARAGLTAADMPNLHGMHNTADPRQFYGVTRALLAPSLWEETFGRVTAEALINGIPVLASNRGGLPEVVGNGGFLFDVPDRYTPDTTLAPTVEEVEPWLETINVLWDDETAYAAACARARQESEKWRPERLASRYHDYFERMVQGVRGSS
jgi:glycosyltransferase involved in cell wall biosynthesis